MQERVGGLPEHVATLENRRFSPLPEPAAATRRTYLCENKEPRWDVGGPATSMTGGDRMKTHLIQTHKPSHPTRKDQDKVG